MTSLTGNRAGQRLGNYQLTRLVGRGGFAEVYLGEHVYLQTLAAVKVLSIQLAQEDQAGFLNEARTIAHLKHPNILSVIEFGVQEGVPFLVMDYAPHGSLREHYRQQTNLTPIKVLPHIKQIATALQYAHQEHTIHRDIKPENILLGPNGEALLSDFGMALGTQSSRTQDMQEIAGTVAYMAPELLQGRLVPASDQYALGIVLYEWLSGNTPFHGSFTEIASQHLLAQPPTIQAPSVSPEVEAVIMRALAKKPEERFENILAFAEAFEQAALEVDETFKAATGWMPPGVLQQIKTAPSIERQPTLRENTPQPASTRPSTAHQKLPSTKIVRGRKVLSRGLGIALIILALLVATSGIALAAFSFNAGRSNNNPQRGTQAQPQVQANAAIWQNTYTRVTSQKPFFSDPLSQNTNGWDNAAAKTRSCLFADGAYHASSLTPYALALCGSSKLPDNLSNIGYQVQMNILRGDEGGLIFRLSLPSSTQVRTYVFSVNRHGTYDLWVINGHFKTLLYRSSKAIHTGLNKPNLLCVIAQRSQIALYINKQYVASVVDTSATTGTLGLFARGLPSTTDVAFSKLAVWRL